MSDGTPYGQFEADLFVEMLQLERQGAGPEFNLNILCVDRSLPERPDWMARFVSDNKEIYGRSQSTMGAFIFALNPAGRQRALEIEKSRQPMTFAKRLAQVPRSDWIALAALVVSAFALFKD